MTALGTIGSPNATLPLVLRPYQQQALSACKAACRRGVGRQLIVQPTGSGKTVVFARIAIERGGRALIVCNRIELIDQAARKLIDAGVDPDEIGTVAAERNEHDRRFVVASIQTLARPERLVPIASDFKTVIVDEAHHAAAPSYQPVLRHLRAGEPGGPLLLGFTATPVRGDGVGLEGVFDEIVHEVALLELIAGGYLSDLRALRVQVEQDFTRFATRAGDYVDAETGKALSAAHAPALVLRAWQEHAAGRSTLVFTPTVQLADEMAQTFAAAGIPAAMVSGETPARERRALLDRFAGGGITVLCNAALLTEGVDLPATSCIIIAKPTKSIVAYAQMVGRGLRRHPGKDDCLVVDVVGSTLDLDLQTVSTLTGLPIETLAGKGATVRGALQKMRDAGETAIKAADGRLVVMPVNLLGSPMKWSPAGTSGKQVLSAGGGGWVLLVPNGDRWNAEYRAREGAPVPLAEGVSLEWAMGVAEDRVRQLGASVLADRAARWRADEPTELQIKRLKRLGVPTRALKGKTKGECSDLIAAIEAARQFGEAA